ncbi:MAG: metal ABC transporter substrate-binding protein [Candidatus Nanopelagicales bacterium]|jgi:ABC-type Zn uptake system ZnuABC Zn-binding protein ZnuA|nr:metal ABC transporter substrate-binding protein [Candidatus Nanopelagicales bacterium]MCU0299441.1 metal ABC transporter substrate-binding protein [Candidatus Nanopelagicales bacterium]
MSRPGIVAALLLVMVFATGCSRNVGTATDPTASAGVPPAVTVAAVDFPSFWLAQEVGGDAIELDRIVASQVAGTTADVFAYIPGLDPAVDQAAAALPPGKAVDLTAEVGLAASPRDPKTKDPYVWFDPVNISPMAQTLTAALIAVSPTEFEASQYYGLRALSLEGEALEVDQRLQEQFNPCRIPTLVVESPVLTYLARAYAFDQVPLILWKPADQPVTALYFTIDAEPAVEQAADNAGLSAVGVDTFTESAPEEDLLQGLLDLGDAIAANQDCPLVTPSSSDRPG